MTNLCFLFLHLADIHDYEEEPVPNRSLYMPDWMSSPNIPRYAPYNWDRLSWSESNGTYIQLSNHKVQVSETYHLPDPNDEDAMTENDNDVDWFSDYMPPGQDPSEPVFDISYPVLDTIDRVTIEDPAKHTLVATTDVSIFWRNVLEDILPYGSDGVVAVFESPCNPTFTFQINGPSVKFIGRGDHHDTKYDRFMIPSSIYDLDAFSSSKSYYSGTEVDTEYCPQTIRMYPSVDFENRYVTSQPLILMAAAVGIFLFTAVVFIAYDVVVECRQKKVMNTATRTSAIVSSLFPSNVRDRLFQQNEEQKEQQKEKQVFAEYFGDGSNGPVNLSSAPIADLFPETTVFFADLAGFTKWSSTRTPTEVFRLLETLYGAFDQVARRRHVFKVETVGDCYGTSA